MLNVFSNYRLIQQFILLMYQIPCKKAQLSYIRSSYMFIINIFNNSVDSKKAKYIPPQNMCSYIEQILLRKDVKLLQIVIYLQTEK